MRKASLFVFTAFLLGIAGGIARLYELKEAFDPRTQLLNSHYTTFVLIVITAVAFAISVLLARKLLSKNEGLRAENNTGMGWYLTEVLACTALAVSAVFVFVEFTKNRHISTLIFALLSAMSAFCLLVNALGVKSGKLSPRYGMFWVIPVFWAAFSLIIDFWGHAGNPVLDSFFYTMAALVFSTLFLSSLAGFFFNRVRMMRTLIYGANAIFFSVVSLLGPLLYRMTGGNMELNAASLSWAKLFQFCFFILHCSAMLVSVGKGRFQFSEEADEMSEHEEPIYDDALDGEPVVEVANEAGENDSELE